jgi:hypothetical protein
MLSSAIQIEGHPERNLKGSRERFVGMKGPQISRAPDSSGARFLCVYDPVLQCSLSRGIMVSKIAEAGPSLRQQRDCARGREQLRVQLQFDRMRYDTPTYCQLADTCAEKIKCGADDESEMDVSCCRYQPQRTANLRVRICIVHASRYGRWPCFHELGGNHERRFFPSHL